MNIRIEASKSWAESLPRRMGRAEYIKFLKGARLSARQAVNAACFRCSTAYDTGLGCSVPECPLVPLNPYNLRKNKANLRNYDDCTEQGNGIV